MGGNNSMSAGTSQDPIVRVRERRSRQPRISIVVPALNEARNLAAVLPTLPPAHEVILVDGGSVDGTVETAQATLPGIQVVRQLRRGKGNALAAGFAQVTGDIVVMFDADGSADPAEIPLFVEALVSGADFAKGSRFCPGGGSSDITPIRNVGNKCLNALMNLSFRTRFTDLCYGYNAFWADMVPLLDLPDHELVVPRDGRDALGRRLRDRDAHQLSLRGGRRRRSPRCPASSATASSAGATCGPSPTGSGSCAPCAPSTQGHVPRSPTTSRGVPAPLAF